MTIKMKQMKVKKYRDEEGNYLIVSTNYKNNYYIVWRISQDGDEGLIIGQTSSGEKQILSLTECPQNKEDAEFWLPHKTIESLVALKDGSVVLDPVDGFVFETETAAERALKLINIAFINQAVWPTWAIEAKKAGWTPPEGWKP